MFSSAHRIHGLPTQVRSRSPRRQLHVLTAEAADSSRSSGSAWSQAEPSDTRYGILLQRRRPSRRFRRRMPAEKPAEVLSLIPNLSRLHAAKVTLGTQKRYTQSLVDLAGWLATPVLPKWSADCWDSVLPDLLEFMIDRGCNLSDGSRLACALLWGFPHIGRPLAAKLPATAAALAGWRRCQPPRSRPPLPYECMAEIAQCLLDRGYLYMSLFTWLAFETYWRPSEGLALRSGSIVPGLAASSGTTRNLSFVLREFTLGVPTKTLIYDASVVLDLPRQQFLVPLVLAVSDKLGMTDERVFCFSLVQYRQAFLEAVSLCGLTPLAPTPYSLRHGGASHDRCMAARSLADIQSRGMWRSTASVARYEKHSLLAQQFRKLTSPVCERILQRAPGAPARYVERF